MTEFFHETVLRQETIDAVVPTPEVVATLVATGEPLQMVDCTLGGGGHAECLIETLHQRGLLAQLRLNLFGIDRDDNALAAASARLAAHGHPAVQFFPLHTSFGQISTEWHTAPATGPIHGLYADFGVSSPQIDHAARGFSLRLDGPLDMRMDTRQETTARDILETHDERSLTQIFQTYGEEPRGRKLARAIVEDRPLGKVPWDSTLAFAKYAERVLGYHGSRTPPSTRIFQALRIAVNDELGEIKNLLRVVPSLVADQAKVAFISFHSLEDRLVKRYLRAWENALPEPSQSGDDDAPNFPHLAKRTWGKEIPRGGLLPSANEIQKNSRAHSARLRAFCFGDRNGRQ